MDEEKTYNFYIYYCNKLNLPSFREDPQEGNGPP
jgi:predicted RNA-binding protein with PUA domain